MPRARNLIAASLVVLIAGSVAWLSIDKSPVELTSTKLDQLAASGQPNASSPKIIPEYRMSPSYAPSYAPQPAPPPIVGGAGCH